MILQRLGVPPRQVVVEALLHVAKRGLPGVVAVRARGELLDRKNLPPSTL